MNIITALTKLAASPIPLSGRGYLICADRGVARRYLSGLPTLWSADAAAAFVFAAAASARRFLARYAAELGPDLIVQQR
jgi:hypothetical protein